MEVIHIYMDTNKASAKNHGSSTFFLPIKTHTIDAFIPLLLFRSYILLILMEKNKHRTLYFIANTFMSNYSPGKLYFQHSYLTKKKIFPVSVHSHYTLSLFTYQEL